MSFVDCPGHDILMATMLNGAAVMDAALLLIAGNESCPQPQTSEHLAAIEIMKLQHILILQNKIDLVKKSAAADQYTQIAAFVKGAYLHCTELRSNPGSSLTRLRVRVCVQELWLRTRPSFPSARSWASTSMSCASTLSKRSRSRSATLRHRRT